MTGLGHRVRPLVARSVKELSRAVDRVAPPPTGVTVLLYHRVGGGTGSESDLDEAVLDEQLARLAADHQVLSLDAAAELLAAPRAGSASRPAVVITVDDGTADFTDTFVPLLVRHGLPATLYVATAYVDEGREFPWGAPPTSWSALRDAASTGLVTIGSHTHEHWLLDRLDPATTVADLDRSIALIGDHIGVTPRHFAYPKAVPGSAAAEVAVRQRFATAALARGRVNRPGHTDLHRLWRTPIQRSDRPEDVLAKLRGGMRVEGELRATVARVRYRASAR